MKHNKIFFIIIIAIFIFFSSIFLTKNNFLPEVWDRLLAGFLFGVVTEDILFDKYQSDKVRILLVPGHDDEYPGAIFEPYTEAELNLEIARELYRILSQNYNLEILTTRDLSDGQYTETFKNYFITNEESINDFIVSRRQVIAEMFADQRLNHNVIIDHNFAPGPVAFRLYGINKWANENNIDIQLHIHLNDYPGRRHGIPGKYSGFSIYVPEKTIS